MVCLRMNVKKFSCHPLPFRTDYFVSLKVALINPNNEVLGLKAREDGALSGFMIFPAGGSMRMNLWLVMRI